MEIDVDRMKNGETVERSFAGSNRYGYPWLIVLDGATPAERDAAVLATSIAPTGNIGCPVTEAEAAHFFEMLSTTRTRLTDAELDVLRAEHEAFAKPIREKMKR